MSREAQRSAAHAELLRTIQPGDVLLYSAPGPLSTWIRVKTWSHVSHVELYLGSRTSVAARSRGLRLYPLDLDAVAVLRPIGSFQLASALFWFQSEAQGQGYDFLGLVWSFYAIRQGRQNLRQVCSELTTRLLRHGGHVPFQPEADADAIAPAQFLQTPALSREWVRADFRGKIKWAAQ